MERRSWQHGSSHKTLKDVSNLPPEVANEGKTPRRRRRSLLGKLLRKSGGRQTRRKSGGPNGSVARRRSKERISSSSVLDSCELAPSEQDDGDGTSWEAVAAEADERHPPSPVHISQRIMKSILTAMTAIERGLKGRDCPGIYQRLSLSTRAARCRDKMMKSPSIELEDFEEFTSSAGDWSDVAEAVKAVLRNCAPLVPFEMSDRVMQITDGSDIEALVASDDWDDARGVTFIALLLHLAKLVKPGGDLRRQIPSSEELGDVFGDILIRGPPSAYGKSSSSAENLPQARGRRVAMLIRHMSADEDIFTYHQGHSGHDAGDESSQTDGENDVVRAEATPSPESSPAKVTEVRGRQNQTAGAEQGQERAERQKGYYCGAEQAGLERRVRSALEKHDEVVRNATRRLKASQQVLGYVDATLAEPLPLPL